MRSPVRASNAAGSAVLSAKLGARVTSRRPPSQSSQYSCWGGNMRGLAIYSIPPGCCSHEDCIRPAGSAFLTATPVKRVLLIAM